MCWRGVARFASSSFGRSYSKLVENPDLAQWQHYVGLCGNWRGKWHRYKSDLGEGKLVLGQQFQAFCNPTLETDGHSVRHVNRYEPGTEPQGRPAQLVDGLYEVDFG